MELKQNPPRRPRVIIIGAGISGLSAATRLSSAAGSALALTVLEASHRTGGRINTSQFSSTGEQIEIGATWIHGIEGSPIYEIAKRIGALQGEIPFECMDGFPKPPIVKAQGGITVENAIVQPIASLYKQLIAEINDRRGAPNSSEKLEDGDAANLGSFLRRRLDKYLCKQSNTKALELLLMANDPKFRSSSNWDLRSIQEGIFANQENWERCVTAAESLNDLDLPAFNEYWEFPGEQITIAKGFSSVVQALAKSLPPNTIQFSKHVQKITWAEDKVSSGYPVQLHCEDGSVLEADHVIVTVSLGVLKAKASIPDSDPDSDSLPNAGLFQPCLPAWKLDAIKKLGFGVVDKLFVLMEPLKDGSQHPNLQLIHRQSPGGEDEAEPRWMRKTPAMYPIHKNSNVLVAWFAGEEAKAMENLSDEETAKGVQATLSSFGDERLVAGLKNLKKSQVDPHSGVPNGCNGTSGNGYITSNGTSGNGYITSNGTSGKDGSNSVSIARGRWNQDPLFLGSYSFVAVGSSGEDIDLLAEPVPRLPKKESILPLQLLFAGEATHREQYSTTHGAYFSGQREADRLLKHYNIVQD